MRLQTHILGVKHTGRLRGQFIVHFWSKLDGLLFFYINPRTRKGFYYATPKAPIRRLRHIRKALEIAFPGYRFRQGN